MLWKKLNLSPYYKSILISIDIIVFGIICFITISYVLAQYDKHEILPVYHKEASLKDIKIVTYTNTDDAYITIHYPRTKNEQINKNIKDFIVSELENFKNNLLSAQTKDELNISFEVFRFNDSIVSFKFNTYTLYQGKSDGTTQCNTMTYNLATANQYMLKDLLNNENSMQVLSQKVYAESLRTDTYNDSIKAAFLNDGLHTKGKTFENFVLDKDKLILLLDSYKTDTGSIKTNSIEIDLENLRDILNVEFIQQQNEAVAEASQSGEENQESPANAIYETRPDDAMLANMKLVALTFDDGPSTFTPHLLEILKREEVKASFFILGSRAEYYPEILQQIAANGHQISSHTYNHKQLTNLSEEEMHHEIYDTLDLIETITGTRPTSMRPPYGSMNDTVRNDSQTSLVLWSVDSLDWHSKNADAIYNLVMEQTGDGDIVLLHDIYESTIQATEKIIVDLKEEGYIFVTVDELYRIKGHLINGLMFFPDE